MRCSAIFAFAFSAFALASPSVLENRNARPQPAALPVGSADPSLDALLGAHVKRSVEERQNLLEEGLLDVGSRLVDIIPTIKALGDLLDSETIEDLHTLIHNGAMVLDDEGTAAAKNLLRQANRILTPQNTDFIVQLLSDTGPLLSAISAVSSCHALPYPFDPDRVTDH